MAVVLILVVAEIIREGQERQKAEAEKRQVQRPLGQVKQSETVDKSTAPKEVILSNKQIVPAKSPNCQRQRKHKWFHCQTRRANARFLN